MREILNLGKGLEEKSKEEGEDREERVKGELGRVEKCMRGEVE